MHFNRHLFYSVEKRGLLIRIFRVRLVCLSVYVWGWSEPAAWLRGWTIDSADTPHSLISDYLSNVCSLDFSCLVFRAWLCRGVDHREFSSTFQALQQWQRKLALLNDQSLAST